MIEPRRSLIGALKVLHDDPALSAAVDQAAANIRDTLDQLGVNMLNKREVQAALAGAVLFHAMTGQKYESKMLSLALSIGSLL